MPLIAVIDPATWDVVSSLGTFGAALFTAVGLILLWWQIRHGIKSSRAEFILQLESDFVTRYGTTYQKLKRDGAWSKIDSGPNGLNELCELEFYLDFFCMLQELRRERLITLASIDNMFAYRFFVGAHNPHAQQLLEGAKSYWDDYYELHQDWTQYRKALGKSIAMKENMLDQSKKN